MANAPDSPAREKEHQTSQKRCSKCGSGAVVRSSPHGTFENLLFVLGAAIVRCQACEDRRARFDNFDLSLTHSNEPGFWRASLAILMGLLVCVLVALYTLMTFHRWPF